MKCIDEALESMRVILPRELVGLADLEIDVDILNNDLVTVVDDLTRVVIEEGIGHIAKDDRLDAEEKNSESKDVINLFIDLIDDTRFTGTLEYLAREQRKYLPANPGYSEAVQWICDNRKLIMGLALRFTRGNYNEADEMMQEGISKSLNSKRFGDIAHINDGRTHDTVYRQWWGRVFSNIRADRYSKAKRKRTITFSHLSGNRESKIEDDFIGEISVQYQHIDFSKTISPEMPYEETYTEFASYLPEPLARALTRLHHEQPRCSKTFLLYHFGQKSVGEVVEELSKDGETTTHNAVALRLTRTRMYMAHYLENSSKQYLDAIKDDFDLTSRGIELD